MLYYSSPDAGHPSTIYHSKGWRRRGIEGREGEGERWGGGGGGEKERERERERKREKERERERERELVYVRSVPMVW